MQILSRFNECDVVFIAFTKSGYSSIFGPVTVTKVEIEPKRIAVSTAWEITYIYTIKELPATNNRYYEVCLHRTIEEALCAVDASVHPKPKPVVIEEQKAA